LNSVLAEWGSPEYPTKLVLKKYRGRRYLDIRKHFGEHPTRKGVMLNQAQVLSLLEAMDANRKSIETWFGLEPEDMANRMANFHETLREARERNAQRLNETSVESKPSTGNGLFHVELRGGEAVVELNQNHGTIRSLEAALRSNDTGQLHRIVGRILQASFQAAALAAPGEGADSIEAAEQHAHFLGMLLAQVED